MSSLRTSAEAFRKNSALCRSQGLATSTKDPGRVNARCTAFAAATVDFPHCREQFRIPRFAVDRSTSICFASGANPSRVSAKLPASSSASAAGRVPFFRERRQS